MNIQTSLTPNAPATIASLRTSLLAARQAVANRQEPGPKYRHCNVMRTTDGVLDTVELGSSVHNWKPETTIKAAAADLRKARNSNFKEAALRMGGALAVIGTMAHLESSALAQGAALAPIASAVGFLALALTRPDKAIFAYGTAMRQSSQASRMEYFA